jgi:nucleotide-binding universal stress UspA family protein
MIPPKSILVPTDFSEPSRAALDYAVDLAEKLGAEVHVVHAFELPLVGFPDGTLTITAEMASRIINAAQKALDDLTARYSARKVKVHCFLEQADPREAVLQAAKKVSADLIVMGTHGRRGIVRALIGSVTESVVRTSSLPVMTIHSTEGARA